MSYLCPSRSLSVGHCISLHTFSKSPRPGLLLPRDLGFLSTQHMLHSYRLSVVLPCLSCFPSSQPRSLFRKKPAVCSTTDECWLREEIKKWRHSMKTNCSFGNIPLHLFGPWDGRILKSWRCNKQVYWGNNITRLLTNCWNHSVTERNSSVGIFSADFALKKGNFQ